jgi:alpha-D-ribose 1-methylphosphonate 5-triphosphate synthase subunit PhnG
MTDQSARQEWMGVLAKSPAKIVVSLCQELVNTDTFEWLRKPEVGGVMVQGRMGATGAPFNMGEITVTRCSLRIPTGEVGHGYVQGRDNAHAQYAALVDAMMQSDDADVLNEKVLQPLRNQAQAAAAHTQARADKTKVDFFTLVRGEDCWT